MFLFLLGLQTSAQHTIKLKGTIDPSILNYFNNDELAIRLKNNADKVSEGKIYKVKLSSGTIRTFETEIAVNDTLAYISFEMENKTAERFKGLYFDLCFGGSRQPNLSELYLFQAGDSININVNATRSYTFSGKGSDKLNCQFQLYNTPGIPQSIRFRSSMLTGSKDLGSAIALEIKALEMQNNLKLAILKTYEQELSTPIYQMLVADAISLSFYSIYTKLPNYKLSFNTPADADIVQHYYNSISSVPFFDNLPNTALGKSAYYACMVYEKEKARSLITDAERDPFKSVPVFKDIYPALKSNYSGLLRDKLITLCFENLFSDDAKAQFNDAIQLISDEDYKTELTNIYKTKISAFPFELFDVNNKVHRLADYKGKLLIIDFWFTGCVPCAMVAKAMLPIYNKYKNNKDIVFITVSTDKKERWLEGLKSGEYTAPDMTNLHTNGMGFAHPLIQYYKFTGFPQQLIVGKNSELITFKPPRPDVGEGNVRAFEQIIDDNLK